MFKKCGKFIKKLGKDKLLTNWRMKCVKNKVSLITNLSNKGTEIFENFKWTN